MGPKLYLKWAHGGGLTVAKVQWDHGGGLTVAKVQWDHNFEMSFAPNDTWTVISS